MLNLPINRCKYSKYFLSSARNAIYSEIFEDISSTIDQFIFFSLAKKVINATLRSKCVEMQPCSIITLDFSYQSLNIRKNVALNPIFSLKRIKK